MKGSKKTKKALALLIATLMVIGILPASVLAHSGVQTQHSHAWDGLIDTYSNRIIAKTADQAKGQIDQTENDSTFNSGNTWHFTATPQNGYEFVNWTINNAYLVNVQSTGNPLVISYKYTLGIGHDIANGAKFTATANFQAITYNISYDLNGGTDPGNPTSYTIESGAITLNNPTKQGYTFTGWSGTDIAGTSMDVTIPAGSTGDRSYTAHWAVIDYNIVYNLNGGTDPGNPSSYTIESGAITLINPTKAGFTFAGWTGTDLSGPTMDVTIPAGSTGDREYTANWTAETYDIVYNLNGGTDPGNPTSYTAESGAITLIKPTKNGYTFTGWTGTDLPGPTMNVTIPAGSTGNREYTAHFTPDCQPCVVHHVFYLNREQTRQFDYFVPFVAETDKVLKVSCYILPIPGYDVTTDPAETLTVTTEKCNNVITIYYTPKAESYTVNYYLEGTTDPVAPQKVGTGLAWQTITESPIDIEGYDPVSTDPQKIVLWPEWIAGMELPEWLEGIEIPEVDNTITFYYTKSEDIPEPTPPLGPVETPTPGSTPTPTSTVNVPESTAPNAPALPVTGENPLDWMLMVGGLVLATGTLLLVSRKRKQGEK